MLVGWRGSFQVCFTLWVLMGDPSLVVHRILVSEKEELNNWSLFLFYLILSFVKMHSIHFCLTCKHPQTQFIHIVCMRY